MKILNLKKFVVAAMLLLFAGVLGCSSAQVADSAGKTPSVDAASWVKLDTIKAGKFDTGRMWTFDFPPKDYFAKEYNMAVTDDWLDNARMAALRFATYCSASFVSEDGLVMTNHHCARESVTGVTKEGEDLHENGFFAATLDDERKVPGLFVDQLVVIKDVTADMQSAIDAGKTDQEKAANKSAKQKELEKQLKDKDGLEGQVVTLYNGGKYSLYGYKRYNDVRLVFAPETQLGFYGGDPDNFTYPRYALDCSFFRVYDKDGKPLKTKNFYKWSPAGAAAGEPVFVVGNPGRTNRLQTVAQLEYQRDVSSPLTMMLLNGLVSIYSKYIELTPAKKAELQDRLFSFSNSQKASDGILKGLRDVVLMQKKRDFEASFRGAVMARPDLAAKYGELWDKIAQSRAEVKKIAFENAAYNPNPVASAPYFMAARTLVEAARNMQLPEDKRDPKYKGDAIKTLADGLYPPDFDPVLAKLQLEFNINFYTNLLGASNANLIKLTGGNTGNDAVEFALGKSLITTKEAAKALLEKGADAILNSGDPFIAYVAATMDRGKELSGMAKDMQQKEADYVQKLGRALFEVYGTSIPPDATFTLRISDGVVQGYDYNGTVAPVNTTFYGLYDRYYSFGGKFPWNLPARWQNPPAGFDLSAPMVFVSTNDIIGGNSGSPVINKKLEIVGLAFDGNIESLPGQFIFTTEANRTVSVHSAGMLEAINDMYMAKRLGEELKAGKIVK